MGEAWDSTVVQSDWISGLSSSNVGQHYLQLLLLALQVCMLRLQGMVEILQVTLTLAHPSLSGVQSLLPKSSPL